MAFDIIGDIIIIKPPYPDNVEEFAKDLLQRHKNVKTVLLQISRTDYPYRVPKYKCLAGDCKTETIHREFGLRFMVDIQKCYFSPRLSNERMRIAKQIGDGEKVLVMFSGVNPYPIYISKFSKASIIYSVELNPWAVRYGLINVKINKVNNINTILGDVRAVNPMIHVLKDREGVVLEESWYIQDLLSASPDLSTIYLSENSKYSEILSNRYTLRYYKFFNDYFEIKGEKYKYFDTEFDRIVMPLPKESHTFLDVTIPLIRNGGVIHLYQFFKEQEIPDQAYKLLDSLSKKLGFEYKILGIIKAGDIAPREFRVCIDFKVFK